MCLIDIPINCGNSENVFLDQVRNQSNLIEFEELIKESFGEYLEQLLLVDGWMSVTPYECELTISNKTNIYLKYKVLHDKDESHLGKYFILDSGSKILDYGYHNDKDAVLSESFFPTGHRMIKTESKRLVSYIRSDIELFFEDGRLTDNKLLVLDENEMVVFTNPLNFTKKQRILLNQMEFKLCNK